MVMRAELDRTLHRALVHRESAGVQRSASSLQESLV